MFADVVVNIYALDQRYLRNSTLLFSNEVASGSFWKYRREQTAASEREDFESVNVGRAHDQNQHIHQNRLNDTINNHCYTT